MEPLRVSSSSRTSGVAGAIAGVIREHQYVEVQAIGAGAVNQALKAIILAKQFLQQEGVQIAFTAVLVDTEVDGNVKTAIKFIIQPRK